MQIIGELSSATTSLGSGGEGPVVVHGDVIPLRLLYLREVWALHIDLHDLAKLAPTPAQTLRTQDGAWLAEWRHAWACNQIAHKAWSQGRQAPAMPDVLHPDWFATDGDHGFASEHYTRWLASALRYPTQGIHDARAAQAAADAAARGLVAIFVIPLAVRWAARSTHLLCVSSDTFTSNDLLTDALEHF